MFPCLLVLPSVTSAHEVEVNASRDRPATVTRARLLTLAIRAGDHWGQTYRGRTGREPGVEDGRNVVGFSRAADSGVGGQTFCFDAFLHVHRDGREHEHCAERDIVINPRVRWQQGPRYPRSNEYDLETVFLHEFGHFSGLRPREGDAAPTLRWRAPHNGEWAQPPRLPVDRVWDGAGVEAASAGSAAALSAGRGKTPSLP